jgi:hypothetical protein
VKPEELRERSSPDIVENQDRGDVELIGERPEKLQSEGALFREHVEKDVREVGPAEDQDVEGGSIAGAGSREQVDRPCEEQRESKTVGEVVVNVSTHQKSDAEIDVGERSRDDGRRKKLLVQRALAG